MVLDFEKVELLLEYQNGVGAWVDLFDSELSFQTTAVKRAHRSPLIMNAICALTAKQLSMASRGGMWEPVAVRYYGESLHHLINMPMNSNTCREDTFAATILLSSHELVSPGLDHRRHVSAALTLIKIHDLNSIPRVWWGHLSGYMHDRISPWHWCTNALRCFHPRNGMFPTPNKRQQTTD